MSTVTQVDQSAETTNSARRSFLALSAAAPAALGGAAPVQTSKAGVCVLSGSGRGAMVTGSSRDIGAATARSLTRDGHAVTVNCRVPISSAFRHQGAHRPPR